jgi:hypothetical protein
MILMSLISLFSSVKSFQTMVLKSGIRPITSSTSVLSTRDSRKKFETQPMPKTSVDETLFTLDGTAMLYRSYFGMESQMKYKGLISTPLYGGVSCAALAAFCQTFVRFLRDFRPKYVAVAFDSGRTFRNDLYPLYKQQRKKVKVTHFV